MRWCNFITPRRIQWLHYSDVIMGAMASQITSLSIVYSTVYSGADQRKHQSSASLAFCAVTGEFPAQIASNTENVSLWWRLHVMLPKWGHSTQQNGDRGDTFMKTWASYRIRMKLRVAHAPGMSGMLSPPSQLAIPTGIKARAWRTCRDACQDRSRAVSVEVGGGGNVPGILGACATRNFTYLVRGPWKRFLYYWPTKGQRSGAWKFLYCKPQQTFEQKIKLPVIWDVITLMWCHCGDAYFSPFVTGAGLSGQRLLVYLRWWPHIVYI